MIPELPEENYESIPYDEPALQVGLSPQPQIRVNNVDNENITEDTESDPYNFPVVDDIYDEKILTDPEHKLYSLDLAALHYKVAYVKQHDWHLSCYWVKIKF